MNIKKVSISSPSYSKTIEFNRINELTQKDVILTNAVLSPYFSLLGATKENKNVKQLIHEELECWIETDGLSWGRKYNAERKTFSDLKSSDMKKQSKADMMSFSKEEHNPTLPCYYVYNQLIPYADGDFFDTPPFCKHG